MASMSGWMPDFDEEGWATAPPGVKPDVLTANWDHTMASYTYYARPTNEDHLLAIVNWAAKQSSRSGEQFRVRASGRGHNWSPLKTHYADGGAVHAEGKLFNALDFTKDSHTVLVDLRGTDAFTKCRLLTSADYKEMGMQPPPKHQAMVEAGCGLTQLEFLTKLEQMIEGGAYGYGVTHSPAPNDITLGGILAIDGHGSCVKNRFDAVAIDQTNACYGTMSNRMVACKAIVFDHDENKYVIKTFRRDRGGDEDIAPFLTMLGRTILVSATLRVEPNFLLRCVSHFNIPVKQLLCHPDLVPPNAPFPYTYADYVTLYGRAEIILFPYTTCPWFKFWQVVDPSNKPKGSRYITESNPFPWADSFAKTAGLIRALCNNNANDMKARDVRINQKEDAQARRVFGRDRYKSKIRRALKSLSPDLVEFYDNSTRLLLVFAFFQDKLQALGLAVMRTVLWIFGFFVSFVISPVKLVGYCMNFAGTIMMKVAKEGDVYGPSKNTLIYVSSETLKVTANGYAIQTSRDNIQQVAYDFFDAYQSLMDRFHDNTSYFDHVWDEFTGKSFTGFPRYPVTQPLEIRVTELDDPTPIGDFARTPPVSAGTITEEHIKNGWDVIVWVDVLSLPGTEGADHFYAMLESAIMSRASMNGTRGLIRPEWSKGWGYSFNKEEYTKEGRKRKAQGTTTQNSNTDMDSTRPAPPSGAWTNQEFKDHARRGLPAWNETMEALQRHDPKNLFSNDWMDDFLAPVPKDAADGQEQPPSPFRLMPPPPPPADGAAVAKGSQSTRRTKH